MSAAATTSPPGGLLEMVAHILANQLKDDVRKGVVAAVNDEIRQQVGIIVHETIEGGVPMTNMFGEATGKSTTMRERIIAEAEKALKSKVSRNGSYDRYNDRDSVTLVQYVAQQVAQDALKSELKQAADEAVAQVKAVTTKLISDEIGAKVSEAVTRGLAR